MTTAYTLVSDAKGMPFQFHYLRVRLKTEQHRLLNWAEVADLTEDQGFHCVSLRLNDALVQEVLREQEAILASFWKVNNTYQGLVDDNVYVSDSESMGSTELRKRFPHSKASLETRAINCIERIRRYPAKIRWAAFDRNRLESALAQLSALNDAMERLLDSQQKLALHQVQTRTSMQVLQLNNKVDHLIQIFHAESMRLPTAHLSRDMHYLRAVPLPVYEPEYQSEREVLATLARFKALNMEINPEFSEKTNDIPASVDTSLLDAAKCTILRSYLATYTSDIERSDCVYANDPCWVEWKDYEPVLQSGQPDPTIQKRISQLSCLLGNAQKPLHFRTPNCVGYFNDAPRNRFGLVFRRPATSSTMYPPTSLFDLILSVETPSLSVRVRLARLLATALQYLHSTDWIHKALRSQNIVFFTDRSRPDLSNPLLCGFGLSRPAHNVEMTERPDSNPLYNLYRHPLAHDGITIEGTAGFKKAFDIYSFGVVLIEIALWMPFHRVLGIDDNDIQRQSRSAGTKNIHGNLLQDNRVLLMVRSAAGDIYGDVVKACLTSLGQDEGDGEEGFQEAVVIMLERVLT